MAFLGHDAIANSSLAKSARIPMATVGTEIPEVSLADSQPFDKESPGRNQRDAKSWPAGDPRLTTGAELDWAGIRPIKLCAALASASNDQTDSKTQPLRRRVGPCRSFYASGQNKTKAMAN